MHKQKLIYLFAGLAFGFAGGFFLANAVNRGARDELRAEVASLRAARPGGGSAGGAVGASPAGLSGEEADRRVRAAVAAADARAEDLKTQREYGKGTYLYAVQTGDAGLLRDAARLLKRAHDADPRDYEATVLLGNAHFDLAQSGSGDFGEARAYYLKALGMKPDDINVRTDLGSTYFYDKPSDPRSAIREYRRSLAADPRHEMTLQGLAAALVAAGELAEAARRLDELERVNPSNRALPALRAQLAQRENAAGEAK